MVQARSQGATEPLVVWQLPEDASNKNAYGRLLMANLEALGVKVVPVAYRHVFAIRALRERPDLIHFQSITPFLLPGSNSRSLIRSLIKAPVFLLQIMLLRLAGCRVVWTVHNLVNHERRLARVERYFSILFSRIADCLIAHGDSAKKSVIRAFRLQGNPAKVAVMLHPAYFGAYPNELTREQARARLGMGENRRMALALGQIRPYKGLLETVSAYRELSEPDLDLWIVGEPVDQKLAAKLQEAVAAAPGIRLKLGHVRDDQIQCYLNACDVFVLAYRSILTSGGALLAMTFGRACIVPGLDTLAELFDEQGAFFFEPGDRSGLALAMKSAEAASAEELCRMGSHNLERVRDRTWASAAARLLDIYMLTMSGRTRRLGASS